MNAMERVMILARHGEVISYAQQLQNLGDLAMIMGEQNIPMLIVQRTETGYALINDEQVLDVNINAEDVFDALGGIFRHTDEFALTRRQLQQLVAQEQQALEHDERLEALNRDLEILASHLRRR